MNKKTLRDGLGATSRLRNSFAGFTRNNWESGYLVRYPAENERNTMEVPNSKNGVSVRAYQGDAMTLLAFDLDECKTENLAGFSVRSTPGPRKPYYLTNLLTYPTAILKKNNIN